VKLQNKKSYESDYSASAVCDEARVVRLPKMFDTFATVFSPLIDSKSRYMSSRAGIGTGRVSRFDFKRTALHSAKVSRMDTSMLRAGRPSSSPATDLAIFGSNSENEFSLKVNDIVPIQDNCGEGILDSNSNIGKENAWSLNVSENRECQERHESNKGDIRAAGIVSTFKSGVQHSDAKDVSESCVDASAASAKDLGIATTLKQSSIGVIAHE